MTDVILTRCYCPTIHGPNGVICRWLTTPDRVICARCARGKCKEQPAEPRGRWPDPDEQKEAPTVG